MHPTTGFRFDVLLCMVVYTYNPNTKEAKIGRFQVLGQPSLHTEKLPQKTNHTKQGQKQKNVSLESLVWKAMNFGTTHVFKSFFTLYRPCELGQVSY